MYELHFKIFEGTRADLICQTLFNVVIFLNESSYKELSKPREYVVVIHPSPLKICCSQFQQDPL